MGSSFLSCLVLIVDSTKLNGGQINCSERRYKGSGLDGEITGRPRQEGQEQQAVHPDPFSSAIRLGWLFANLASEPSESLRTDGYPMSTYFR